MSTRRGWGLILGCVLLPLQTRAQPEVVLRSTTRLIQVEVIVRDKAGQPVSGLTKDDFLVLEDGKRQTIGFFSATPVSVSKLGALEPGMASNRLVGGTGRQGVIAILVDSLNTNWRDAGAAREQLRKFLRTANPNERIALYSLRDKLRVSHEFTSNAAALLKKLDQPESNASSAGMFVDLIPESAELGHDTAVKEKGFQDMHRIDTTLEALANVAGHLGAGPGVKSLVWITSGIPMVLGEQLPPEPNMPKYRYKWVDREARHNYNAEFTRVERAFSNANVAVYPMDPRGLLPRRSSDVAKSSPLDTDVLGNEAAAMMRRLAEATGGRAFTNENDIQGALRKVGEDAQHSYSLAYYAASGEADGRYHTISVKMKRPELTASHRRGYYAVDQQSLAKADELAEIRAAASAVLDSGVVGIDAKLEGGKVLARIDTAELMEPASGGFGVRCTVGVFQYDADGKPLDSLTDKIEFKLDARKAAALAENGLSYSRPVRVSANAALVKLVVRSAVNGAIGTLTLPAK